MAANRRGPRRSGLELQSMPNRSERKRWGSTTATSALLTVSALASMAVCEGMGTSASAFDGAPKARAARSLNVRDEGHLRFIRSSGSELLDEGRAAGTFPGWVKVRFTYNGEPTVSARFTIYGAGGSISARGSGRLSNPVSPSPSFRGHLLVTGGSGRYAHVHGLGELFGVFYRRSYGLTVQATGKLSY